MQNTLSIKTDGLVPVLGVSLAAPTGLSKWMASFLSFEELAFGTRAGGES